VGIAGIQAHRLMHMGNRLGRHAGAHLACGECAHGVHAVRVQFVGAPGTGQVFDSTQPVRGIDQHKGPECIGIAVVTVDRDRLRRRRQARLPGSRRLGRRAVLDMLELHPVHDLQRQAASRVDGQRGLGLGQRFVELADVGVEAGHPVFRQGADAVFVDAQALGAAPMHLLALGIVDVRGDRRDDAACQFLLHLEDVFQDSVVLLGPQVVAAQRIDQLAGDANALARLADAAFQHVTHAEFLTHAPNVGRLALVRER